MRFPYSKSINLVCGHYGCGKTTFSLNLVQQLALLGQPTCLVDLDLVNPYFRSSDYRAEMEKKGIRCISPQFAGSNLESPSLSAEIDQVFFDHQTCAVMDLGGDSAGATVFGRYAPQLEEKPFACFYLVNCYRGLSVSETLTNLKEIETRLRVSVTAIVNNSNIGEETTLKDLEQSRSFVKELCNSASLPLAATCCSRQLFLEQLDSRHSIHLPFASEELFPIKCYPLKLPLQSTILEMENPKHEPSYHQ